MNNAVLLGIDLGTTVLKVAAFDAGSGAVLACGTRRLPVRVVAGGGREQSPRGVDRAFGECVAELRERLGDAWRDVRGIGLAAQGGSSLFADRGTGRPRSTMYLWNDGRAYPYVHRLATEKPKRYWRDLFLFDTPPTGLGRLLWLKENRPELFAHDAIHIGAGEYLFHRLTGLWRQDAGNAIQIGSYNAKKKRLDGRALALGDVPLSVVAPLRNGHETATLTKKAALSLGVDVGLPVAGPYMNQEAGYLSVLGACERPLQCSLGTAWVGNFTLPEGATGRSPSQMVLPALVGEGRFVIQALLAGNTTWDWALTTFVNADHDVAIEQAKAVFSKELLPPDGQFAIPWGTQANPLVPGACGGAVFLGVSADTSPADLLRAVAAGMVFELARMFEAVKASGSVEGVVLGGGAANASYFRKLVAALFAPLPLYWQRDGDMAAARGSLYPLNPRAARCACARVRPSGVAAVDRVQRAYGLYKEAYARVYGGVAEGEPFRF